MLYDEWVGRNGGECFSDSGRAHSPVLHAGSGSQVVAELEQNVEIKTVGHFLSLGNLSKSSMHVEQDSILITFKPSFSCCFSSNMNEFNIKMRRILLCVTWENIRECFTEVLRSRRGSRGGNRGNCPCPRFDKKKTIDEFRNIFPFWCWNG